MITSFYSKTAEVWMLVYHMCVPNQTYVVSFPGNASPSTTFHSTAGKQSQFGHCYDEVRAMCCSCLVQFLDIIAIIACVHTCYDPFAADPHMMGMCWAHRGTIQLHSDITNVLDVLVFNCWPFYYCSSLESFLRGFKRDMARYYIVSFKVGYTTTSWHW